ncbi:hypothetical protein ACFXHA_03590 [Nocardia sp. NPDC059240]|uniref:hypothetical protein n=1 Tax=Nocardia sp. NPDC059240 TaxID=3346786 RepID=UPI0036C4A297
MKLIVRSLGWTATVLTVASVGLASAPFAAADDASPLVNDCTTGRSNVEPARILLACGDGNLTVRDINWSSWGPDTAEGDGTEYRVVCQPSCASGHEATASTHITLRNPRDGYFTEAVITDLNGQPETWPVGPLRH